MLNLGEVNALDRSGFIAAFGHIFEHSPWLVASAWEMRPFTSVDDLRAALVATMLSAAREDQIELLRAHPDLAGKAALAQELTPDSTREQASAGLDRMSAAEYALFHQLNAAYREKFSFPFVICVRHHDKASILAEYQRRLGEDSEIELPRALGEVGEIAWLRLLDLVESNTAQLPVEKARPA